MRWVPADKVLGIVGWRMFPRALAPMLGLALGISSPAFAQGIGPECRSNPHLSRAKDEYDRLEFDRAARTLQRALEYSRNCRWDLAEIFRLKAFVDAVNAEREKCQRAFEILLALDPEYSMPSDVPPKIRDCFADAERVPAERRELKLVHEPLGVAQPNAPVSVSVEVVDPLRLVDMVQVYFRRDGVKVYTTVMARADDRVALVIPALSLSPDPKGYRVEYFVRAVDRWEGTLEELGNARKPLAFSVAPGSQGEGSVVETWWFWTLLAAAAAGGATLFVLATQGSGDSLTLTIKEKTVGG